MNIVITDYQESDADALKKGVADINDIERKISDTREPGEKIAGAYLEQIQQAIAEKSGAIFVAKDDETVLGFIACWVEYDDNVAETPESNTYGYISDAYVFSEYRNQGIFKQLNARAEEFLRENPVVHLVRINVLVGNEVALNAYKKSGYSPYEMKLEKKIR